MPKLFGIKRIWVDAPPWYLEVFCSMIPAIRLQGLLPGNVYNAAKPIIGSIDLAGGLTKCKILNDSTFAESALFENVLIKTSEGKFAFTGYYIDSLNYLYFGIANSTLDSVITFRYYSPNVYRILGNAMLQKNGSYYVTGLKTDSLQNDPNVFLMKIDAAGNRVYEKKFGVSNRYERAKSIIALPNEHLLIGAVRFDNISAIQKAQTWLIEVDTTGRSIRQWLDPNDSTYDAYGLKQTADGGFIYCSQKKIEDPDVSWADPAVEGMIVKLSPNFQKEWVYLTGGDRSIYALMRDVEINNDGTYIACGTRPGYESDTNLMGGWIVKLDYYGQVIWEKAYRGISADRTFNYLIDLDILPDGSIIAVGECQGNGNGPAQVGWFLKLDSNGCEVENCLVGIEETTSPHSAFGGDFNSQIQMQPNPANGVVQLTIENEMIGGSISLYNLTGALVLQQTATGITNQLNIAALSKGLYIVTVQKQGQLARARLVVE
jgi:hypothetical protein